VAGPPVVDAGPCAVVDPGPGPPVVDPGPGPPLVDPGPGPPLVDPGPGPPLVVEVVAAVVDVVAAVECELDPHPASIRRGVASATTTTAARFLTVSIEGS
jgi:hypothetical protein